MNKKFFGSIVSVLGGWVCGWLCLVGIYFFGNQQYEYDHYIFAVQEDLGYFVLMGFFIVPSWLVVFMPIYMLFSKNSAIWRLYFCLPIGALAGALIMQSFFTSSALFTYHESLPRALEILWPIVIPASVVGAIACLIAKLTFDRFND